VKEMGKKEETVPDLHAGNGRLKIVLAGGHYNIGSGLLRWLPKQGGVIQAFSNHTIRMCALGPPFARYILYSLCPSPIQGDL
jgi:hypothetical protein